MAKDMGDIALRVWTPQVAAVRFLKQVAPAVEDLTARRTQAAPQTGDYPTGAWRAGSRDYHLCVEVTPAAAGQEMLAARVSLIADTASGQQTLGQGLVRVMWTDESRDDGTGGVREPRRPMPGPPHLSSALGEPGPDAF
jgi:hypothetical protein